MGRFWVHVAAQKPPTRPFLAWGGVVTPIALTSATQGQPAGQSCFCDGYDDNDDIFGTGDFLKNTVIVMVGQAPVTISTDVTMFFRSREYRHYRHDRHCQKKKG